MRDHLGLKSADDGDDLIEQVEAAFGVRLGDEDWRQIVTVGDLIQRLSVILPQRPGACDTAMSFYRLRAALVGMGQAERRARPDDALPEAMRQNPRKAFADLRRRSGFQNLGTRLSWLGVVSAWGLILALAFLVGSLMDARWMLAGFCGVVLAASVSGLILDRGQSPRDLATLGDLACHVAAQNHGQLIVQGAAVRPERLWAALVEVVGQATGWRPEDIGPETRFYASKARVAASTSA